MKPRRESEVKAQVMRTLRLLGCMAFRMNAGQMQLESNGRKRFIKMAPSGTADILAFVGSFPLWIECKREGAKRSRQQIDFAKMVLSMGHHYVVAFGAYEVSCAVAALRSEEQ